MSANKAKLTSSWYATKKKRTSRRPRRRHRPSVPKALQAIRVSCGCTELIHVIVPASRSRAGLRHVRVLHPPHVRVALFRGALARVAMLSNKVGCNSGRTSSLPTNQQHAPEAFTSCGNDVMEFALACRQHAAATASAKWTPGCLWGWASTRRCGPSFVWLEHAWK